MSAASQAGVPGVAARRAGEASRALWFSGALLTISLALQRFGLPFGGKSVSIVGPLGFGLVAYGLATGALCFDRGRLMAFLGLVGLVILGTISGVTAPVALNLRASISSTSLLQFLFLTSFAIFSFTEAVDEAAFFRLVTRLFLFIAIAGILQFVAQFAGLKLFAFTGLLPDSLLIEDQYNLKILVGVGEVMKSNGLLLVEPSVFSQMMALALIIETVGGRRPLYLAAFLAGLMLSFSGTGWIVLAAFVAGSALTLGSRGLVIALAMVLLLAATLGVLTYLSPDFMNSLSGRFGEINQPGTSGHARFITPFWLLGDVFSSSPSAFLLGIGGGSSEKLTLPYAYAVNTPIKIMVDYGVPALVLYVLLFVLGRRTRIQSAIHLPALVLFFLTGGYQQFPPIIFIVLLLTSVAKLRPPARVAPMQPIEERRAA